MPASRSRNREADPPISKRSFGPLALLLLLAAIIVIVLLVLPASLIAHFLPPEIHAEDFSGSIWHGSSGRVLFDSRPAGAIEWRLHPLSLLSIAVDADVRWVKGASVIDAEISADRHGFKALDVRGGGPLTDLRDLGFPAGWTGDTRLDLKQIEGSWQQVESAAGTLQVSALASARIARGADLGGYVMTLQPDSDGGKSLAGSIHDTGGPLEVQAEIHCTPASHAGLLSGTVKERDAASPALREEVSQLAQMRPRDQSGRIPVELEFSM